MPIQDTATRTAVFWSHVTKSDGCWIWTAARDQRGYGCFRWNGRLVKAHRVAWMIERGPIGDGLHACHRCDNPPCVRPDHIFLGTASDNMRDAYTKGRLRAPDGPRGETHHKARLTAIQVVEVRSLLAGRALRHREIATMYGVGRTTITAIAQGKNWKH
jgi:hypothetical protein